MILTLKELVVLNLCPATLQGLIVNSDVVLDKATRCVYGHTLFRCYWLSIFVKTWPSHWNSLRFLNHAAIMDTFEWYRNIKKPLVSLKLSYMAWEALDACKFGTISLILVLWCLNLF